MTLLAGTDPQTPDPSQTPPDATDGADAEATTPAYTVGELVEQDVTWPEPRTDELLVVAVDDRGWVRTVHVEASGWQPPDSVRKAE